MTDQTASQWLGRLNRGELTSAELTRAMLDRIERHDRAVHAFLRVDADAALAQAEAVDRRRRDGGRVGRLGGCPWPSRTSGVQIAPPSR
jgi:Asp-tRNA(Asn)/Glu-tRNA(Gln) amidotransferase A subunit family amidase